MVERSDNFLKNFCELVTSKDCPPPRFGHTVNLVSKTTVVIFGGAISSPGNYQMTADLYLYNMVTNAWKKLETTTGIAPHARAAHASATVRENQLLVYGGSIGNGQYAQDDLWFLDIKNNEDASWMKVPIEGNTPGLRYGHTMVYIMPILILFGGSGKSDILNDIWLLSTDKTPFKWEKLTITGNNPLPRVYHTGNFYKLAGNNSPEMMVIFGGREKDNNSLCDLIGLRRDIKNEWEWVELSKSTYNDFNPVTRHQHCAAYLGPFLFIVGGRVGSKEQATFDVFSMNKNKWFRFGNIALFRHAIWVYYNISSQDAYEVYLYIYGGFDGDNNSQINSTLYRVNIVDLFSNEEILKNELNEYISMLLMIQTQKRNKFQQSTKSVNDTKNQFTMNNKAIVYGIQEENTNDAFSDKLKSMSLQKLVEVDKKLIEVKQNKISHIYDENLVREFLILLPLPEHFEPLGEGDMPIILNPDYISSLIKQCKVFMMKTPTLLRLKYPIKIFGSLHGQYNDLIRYFNYWGRPHEHKGDIESVEYLFMGNFVNRGAFSIEVLCLLMALKVF